MKSLLAELDKTPARCLRRFLRSSTVLVPYSNADLFEAQMKQRLSLSQRPIQEREPAAMSGLEALIAAPIKKLYQPTEPGSSEPIAAPAKINMASIAAEVAMKEERRRKKASPKSVTPIQETTSIPIEVVRGTIIYR